MEHEEDVCLWVGLVGMDASELVGEGDDEEEV